MIKIPKYCLALATPDGEDWLVRTRQPLIVALVEPLDDGGARLHYWTPEIVTDAKLHRSLEALLSLWSETIDERPSPARWEYVGGQLQPPPYLLCDSHRSGFSGVLRLTSPRLWMILDDEDGVEGFISLEGEAAPPSAAASDTQAWYDQFVEVEDDL